MTLSRDADGGAGAPAPRGASFPSSAFPSSAPRWAAAVVAALLGLGCGTNETKTDGPIAARPMPPPPKKEEPKPVVATPPPPPPPETTPPPKPVDEKSKDGIDDDNWLPQKGAGREAFLSAVETARTDPAAAVSRFVDAAGKATYFYAAWFNAGAAAESAGDPGMAEKYYRQTLVVRPDYGPALANLAALLDRTGRSSEAKRLVDDAVNKMPDKAGPHLAAATLAWLHRDTARVHDEALATIRYDERSVPAMLLMAKLFRSQGRLDTARFALENALNVEPGNAVLHLELGEVQLEQDDDKAALVSFEKAARLRPTLVEAQDNYGVLLLRQGLATEAVRAFQEAARLDPKSARAQLHLGNGLRALKEYPQAEAAYHKALADDPAFAEAHFNLGVLYIDDPVPGLDEIARLQKGLAELKQYKSTGKPDAATRKRLDDYIDATDKRVEREIKRKQFEEKRKLRDAKKAKEDAAKAAAGNPPAGGAVSPAKGDSGAKP